MSDQEKEGIRQEIHQDIALHAYDQLVKRYKNLPALELIGKALDGKLNIMPKAIGDAIINESKSYNRHAAEHQGEQVEPETREKPLKDPRWGAEEILWWEHILKVAKRYPDVKRLLKLNLAPNVSQKNGPKR